MHTHRDTLTYRHTHTHTHEQDNLPVRVLKEQESGSGFKPELTFSGREVVKAV